MVEKGTTDLIGKLQDYLSDSYSPLSFSIGRATDKIIIYQHDNSKLNMEAVVKICGDRPFEVHRVGKTKPA